MLFWAFRRRGFVTFFPQRAAIAIPARLWYDASVSRSGEKNRKRCLLSTTSKKQGAVFHTSVSYWLAEAQGAARLFSALEILFPINGENIWTIPEIRCIITSNDYTNRLERYSLRCGA